MSITDEFKGYISVFFAVFIWSFGEILIKVIQNDVGPYAYTFLRFSIGALFLFSILGVKKDISGLKGMAGNNWGLVIIASFFGLGISHVLFFIGISNTYANVGSLIFTTYPIWTTLYSIFVLNERTNLKLKFIGITVGIFGITILMLSFQSNNFLDIEQLFGRYSHLFGMSVALIAAMVWSVYSVAGKKIQKNCEELSNCDLKYTALSLLLAIIPIFFILIFTPDFEAIFHYDLNTWFWVIILGIFSSGIAYYLFFKGVQYIEVSKGISLAFLKPIIAAFFAFIILGEEVTVFLLISIILVFIAIYLINRNSNRDSSANQKEIKYRKI
ncbi:MAG: DMT family transporter [Candidatus Helarchaeota archaeon]